MAQWWQILLGLWAVLPTLAGDKLLSVCMNSKRHKQEPGPEDELYQEVVPNGQEEQRVWGVPLCQEDCEDWWRACHSSLTCKSNWLHGWDWSEEKKHCPAHEPCLPFSYHFPTPDDLCEKIWNNTFKASPERRNSGRCLQKWFEPTLSNPNVEVALHFAGSALAPQLSYTLPAFSLCLLFHP
uniref:Folate receptor 4 (Delta) transcript variant 4 n=2 Tax=Mus musculus TaxID=10090 RepID=B0FFS7_MOUSE|nr:folate receptor 4 (delta) transcript variant 4 [Mus musculus]ABY56300.1 folate receptor 4 (delta) transcript variant 4 [Mus musculus]